MTHVEWLMVHRMVEKYGRKGPLCDVGGWKGWDYCQLSRYGPTPEEEGIFWTGLAGMWSLFAEDWETTHSAEDHSKERPGHYGTIVSTSVLEHVNEPRTFIRAVGDLLYDGGLAILSTVWVWPVHGEMDEDRWRFTEGGLKLLVSQEGLNLLDSGYLKISEGRIHSCVTFSKGELAGREPCSLGEPEVRRYET